MDRFYKPELKDFSLNTIYYNIDFLEYVVNAVDNNFLKELSSNPWALHKEINNNIIGFKYLDEFDFRDLELKVDFENPFKIEAHKVKSEKLKYNFIYDTSEYIMLITLSEIENNKLTTRTVFEGELKNINDFKRVLQFLKVL